MTDDKDRMTRLAGANGEGGGLPLPLLFGSVLSLIMDATVGATADDVLATVSTSLAFKQNRVMSVHGSWRKLVDDTMDQLAECGAVTQSGDTWARGPALVDGQYIVVIPAGVDRPEVGTVAWPRTQRDVMNAQSHAEGELASLLSRGSRPVDRTRAAEIAGTAAKVGHIYPVLKDQHGRVLDGRHRLEADPAWETKPVHVTSDEQAAAIAMAANSGRPWDARTRNKMAQLLGTLEAGNDARRLRIETALLEGTRSGEATDGAARSDREIAEITGTDKTLVARVRLQLVENTSCTARRIHKFVAAQGRGGRRPGTHSPACWCKPLGDAPAPPSPPRPKRTKPKVPEPTLEELTERASAGIARGLNQSEVGKELGLADNSMILAKAFGIAEYMSRRGEASATTTSPAQQTGSPAGPQGSPDHVPDWTVRVCRICGKNESEHP